MPSNRTVRPVSPTTTQVREWAQANPSKVSNKDGSLPQCLMPGARGLLSGSVIKAYNTGVKPEKQYAPGNTGKANSAKAAQRSLAASKGVNVGKRGPLSKAAIAALNS